MAPLLFVLVGIGLLLAIDLLALHAGRDSRDGIDGAQPHPLR